MAEISGKGGKTSLHVITGAMPVQKRLNSESMTIMPMSA